MTTLLSIDSEDIKPGNIGFLILIVAGLLCAQCFSVLGYEIIAPILAGSAALIFSHGSNSKLATSSVAMLVAMVDNGGGVYTETPALLRYLVYFFALTTLVLLLTKIDRKRLIISGFFLFCRCVIFPIWLVAGNPALLSKQVFQRDILLVAF